MADRLPNIDLGKTKITDKIRVSSAAIFYESWFGNYYQLETFIFSDDKEHQRTRQIIHFTTYTEIPEKQIDKVKKIHRYISDNLLNKLTSSPFNYY